MSRIRLPGSSRAPARGETGVVMTLIPSKKFPATTWLIWLTGALEALLLARVVARALAARPDNPPLHCYTALLDRWSHPFWRCSPISHPSARRWSGPRWPWPCWRSWGASRCGTGARAVQPQRVIQRLIRRFLRGGRGAAFAADRRLERVGKPGFPALWPDGPFPDHSYTKVGAYVCSFWSCHPCSNIWEAS